MTSQSRSETSRINVRFTPDARSRFRRRRRARQGRRACAASCPTRSTSRSSPRSRPIRSRSSTSRSRRARCTPLEASDYVKRYIQPRLSVLPGAADVRIFGERAGVDAHQPRPHAPRRLQAHRAGRRGRDPPAERRDPGGPHRVDGARVHRRRRDRPAHRPSSSTTSSSPTSAAIRCASATSATPRSAPVDERIDLALQRQAVAQHRRHQAGGGQSARAVQRRCARRSTKINDGLPAGHEARSSPTTRRCSSTARSSRCSRRSARRSCSSCW